jgi:hypothetical protein
MENLEKIQKIQKKLNKLSNKIQIEKSISIIEKAITSGKLNEDIIEKAKFIERIGEKGNYRYIYKKGVAKNKKSLKEDSDKKNSLYSEIKKNHPDAVITEKQKENKEGKNETIVYVNGETAFNKEDKHNSENWNSMMENAYRRSKNKN